MTRLPSLSAEPLEVVQDGHVIGHLVLGKSAIDFEEHEPHERPTARPPSSLRGAFGRFSRTPRAHAHAIREQVGRYLGAGLPPLPPGTLRAMASHAFSMAPSSKATTVRMDLPPGTRQA
jgi:hypothetical protein